MILNPSEGKNSLSATGQMDDSKPYSYESYFLNI